MPEIEITEPGIYAIPEDAYHADPVEGDSLSASDCKVLLEEGGPAKYHYRRKHPKPATPQMELGTAAHKLVLGVGEQLVEVKADSWRTNAAKDAAKAAREAGALPLLSEDLRTVEAMAARLREPGTKAARMLRAGRGEAEQSGFWQDHKHGIWRRCRWDFLPDWRPLVVDYKSCADASATDFPKAVENLRYHLQAAWYCDAYEALLGEKPDFAWVAQEKEPPYNVAVYTPDPEMLAVGRSLGQRAMRLWRECREAGAWPGYPDEIQTITLPPWSASRKDFYAS